MSKGDVNFVFVAAGSSTASTAATYPLFGQYNGLSSLNEDEAVFIQLTAVGANEFFVGPAGFVSNNIGYKIYPTSSGVDLPPMRVGTASTLLMSRGPSGLDATHNWVVWARRP